MIDIRLGEDDGIALTRSLLDADPDRRIVLYTGSSDEDLLCSGLDSGARGYALKDGSPRRARRRAVRGRGGRDLRRPAPAPGAALAPRNTEKLPSLSNREREVLDLLAQGLTGEGVAERLVLSSETIKTHIRNAMTKLEATHARPRDRHRAARGLHLAARGRGGRGAMSEGETTDRAPAAPRPAHAADIVTGFAEILAGDRPVSDEDRRDYAQRIVAAADEIRELLDAAKLAGE